MIERDTEIVENELVRLIEFIARPEGVPADQRGFQFRQYELGTITKAEGRGRSQYPAGLCTDGRKGSDQCLVTETTRRVLRAKAERAARWQSSG